MNMTSHTALFTFNKGLSFLAPLFENFGEPEVGPYHAKYRLVAKTPYTIAI